MKKKIISAIMGVIVIITGAVSVCATVLHDSPPTDVYNFMEEENPYEVSGISDSNAMFSAYHFCGGTTYLISLENHQDDKQKITIYQTSNGDELESFTIPANGTYTCVLSTSEIWYMEIECPWYDFNGVNVTGTIYATIA